MRSANARAGVRSWMGRGRSRLWFAALTASISLAGASVAVSQGAPTPTATDTGQNKSPVIDTIEVTAKREGLRQEVASFVASVTRTDDENLARWRDPLCAWIAGASPEQAEFIKSRVGEIARSVGVRVSDKPKCKPNLLVFLTMEPSKLLAVFKERSPATFSSASSQEGREVFDRARPVRVWQNSMLLNADGTLPILLANAPPQYRLKDSRIASSVAESISAVVIIVDASSTGTATFGQLADYVTMVSLAQVDLDAQLGSAPTILRLFTDNGRENVPRRMTDWDYAFLKAVYGPGDPLLYQKREITTRMVQDLAPHD